MAKKKKSKSSMYKPKELDLHGLSHEDAELAVLNFIINEDLPVHIITGNSEKMHNIVKTIIKRYNFYYYPQHWFNNGCLVINDKEL